MSVPKDLDCYDDIVAMYMRSMREFRSFRAAVRLLQENLLGAPQDDLLDGEWNRAAGDTVCATCTLPYADHPPDPRADWVRVLCDRRRVKL